MRNLQRLLGTFASVLVLSACGGSDSSDQTGSVGGTGLAGSVASGGNLGLGGAGGTGLTSSVASSGNLGLGGLGGSTTTAPASSVAGGSSLGLGGATTAIGTGTGGVTSGGTTTTGGKSATSGTTTTGGKSATGGTTATGGKSATGGTTATGGKSATGGTTATGGTKATGGTTSTGGSTNLPAVTVYLAGDSIVANYTLTTPKDESNKEWSGWGQMLNEYLTTKVTINNQASGGMTARHFIQAGKLDTILSTIKSGDYLLIQFGTNDSNTTATYTIGTTSYPYFASTTDFKTYLQTFIDGAKAKGATPILVTPPPRNSAYCNGGRSMAGYATAMVELGAAQSVAVVNLSMKTWTYLSAICPAPASAAVETFFRVYSNAGVLTIDGTHFQEHGARLMAGFIATGLTEAGVGLAAYRL